jgi:hypothetical protein
MSNIVNAKYKILEMPAGLFDRAVAAAHAMDEREGEFEDMPSVKIICDWWNANCPDKKLRRAGSFSIYLRDAEDPSKWNCIRQESLCVYAQGLSITLLLASGFSFSGFSSSRTCNRCISSDLVIQSPPELPLLSARSSALYPPDSALGSDLDGYEPR